MKEANIVAFEADSKTGYMLDPTVRFELSSEQPQESDNEKKAIMNLQGPTIKINTTLNILRDDTSTRVGTEESEYIEYEEDELDPFAAHHHTSYLEALTHLLRGNIGPGVLAMGDGYKNAGLVVAPIGIAIIGVICVHCQHILLRASKEIAGRLKLNTLPHFAETVQMVFRVGPKRVQRYAGCARHTVDAFLCITQMGFCCVYFVFISENFKQVLDEYAPDHGLEIHTIMLIIFIPILICCWIKSLKFLAPVSTVANALMAFGIVGTVYEMVQELPPVYERHYSAPIHGLPLFFGTVIYAFEGISLVLPLQEHMKKPELFSSICGVLNVAVGILGTLLLIVGFLAYLRYGDDIKGSVTLNLPPDKILPQLIKMSIASCVLLTYSLQMYVPVRILWPKVHRRFKLYKHTTLWEIAFRSFLVLITLVLAEAIPKLGLFISLIGAVSSCSLALLIPPVLEIVLYWDTGLGRCMWIFWKDVSIFIFGMIGAISGCYYSLQAIVLAYNEPPEV